MHSMKVVGLLLITTLLGFSGCATPHATTGPASSTRPEWIAHPKSDDSTWLYRLGRASGQPNLEAARDAAYADALATFSKEMLSLVKVQEERARLTSGFAIRNAEIMPECVYFETGVGGFAVDAYVQVRWPIREKDKLVERIDLGERLNRSWAEARDVAHQGDYAGAQQRVEAALADYEKALYVGFEADEAKLFMGSLFQSRNDQLMARQWYERVAGMSADPAWRAKAAAMLAGLPPAPLCWPLHDRFGGRKIALVAGLRNGKDIEAFPALSATLVGNCTEARLPFEDVTARLDEDELAGLFDRGEVTEISHQAAKNDAGVLLAVLADIDPALTGKTQQLMGTTMPMLDTTVRFYVIEVSTAAVRYNGQFKEQSSEGANSRLGQRAGSILMRNYLLPKCPPIGK